MANELTITCRVDYSKDGVEVTEPPVDSDPTITIDVAGTPTHQTDILLSTTERYITANDDMDNGGYVRLENLDSTATMSMVDADDTTHVPLQLLPGDVALFRCGQLQAPGDGLNGYKFVVDAGTAYMRVTWFSA